MPLLALSGLSFYVHCFFYLNPCVALYDLCTPAFRLIPGLIAQPLRNGI